MERDISEKSAFIKRTLELDGLDTEPFYEQQPEHGDDPGYLEFSSDISFSDDTPTKTGSSMSSASDVSSARKSAKHKSAKEAVDVTEIHNQIVNHISNLSMGKKIELVNQSGATGYDVAIEQIQRQKRGELSKLLRDMCNDSMRYGLFKIIICSRKHPREIYY